MKICTASSLSYHSATYHTTTWNLIGTLHHQASDRTIARNSLLAANGYSQSAASTLNGHDSDPVGGLESVDLPTTSKPARSNTVYGRRVPIRPREQSDIFTIATRLVGERSGVFRSLLRRGVRSGPLFLVLKYFCATVNNAI